MKLKKRLMQGFMGVIAAHVAYVGGIISLDVLSNIGSSRVSPLSIEQKISEEREKNGSTFTI